MACPECQYPNDRDFRFCQRCGYAKREQDNTLPGRLPSVGWEGIRLRKQHLFSQRSSSNPRDLMSATPDDVVSFLIWKDARWKTKGDLVLVNQTFGKTVRGEQVRSLGVKACSDKHVCPVEGLVSWEEFWVTIVRHRYWRKRQGKAQPHSSRSDTGPGVDRGARRGEEEFRIAVIRGGKVESVGESLGRRGGERKQKDQVQKSGRV
ncbi:hypothetical protein Bbelb_082710 [Branchiostoma belcheri]|nr:hypothetical protein Bbelb_082710 [Branchiostoma belcheri]